MSEMMTVELGELTPKIPSVNPANFPDEIFDLLSIPAYDAGNPQVVTGAEIGSSKQLVQPGDVMISKIVPHIRRVWIVPQPTTSGRRQLASSEWIVFRTDKVLNRWLRFYLLSDRFHAQFMNTVAGVGGSLLRARPQFVKKIKLTIPPLSAQEKEAEIEELKAAIQQKREHQQALFEELQKSIFIETFGNPVTNSKNLPLIKLGDLGTLDRGISKHRPRNAPELLGGPYPLIQTGDVANSGGFITSYTSTYSELGLQQSKIWPAGTLCITIAANIAKTGILTFDACFPDSVVGFTSTPEKTLYVKFILDFLQEILEASAPQSAQKNINLNILRNLKIPSPKLEDLIEFSTKINLIKQ